MFERSRPCVFEIWTTLSVCQWLANTRELQSCIIARLRKIAKWPKLELFTNKASAKLHHCSIAQNCKMARIANVDLASIFRIASLPDCAILQNGTIYKCSQSKHLESCIIAQLCNFAKWQRLQMFTKPAPARPHDYSLLFA